MSAKRSGAHVSSGQQGWGGAFDRAREVLQDLPDPAPAGDGGARYVQIAQVLCDAIAARKFSQGARLPTSAAIAWRFDVSVDTARAALAHLVALGLVSRVPGGGAYVRGALQNPPSSPPPPESG